MRATDTLVEARDDYLSFIRSHAGRRVFCAFNLTNAAQPLSLPEGTWTQDKGAPFEISRPQPA